MRYPRIFLGPLEICGYYGGLARGLRELGLTAHFLDVGDNRYGYATRNASHPRIDNYLDALRQFEGTRDLPRWDPRRYLYTARLLTALWAMVLWIAFCHDVVALKSGLTLLPWNLDLKLYRLLGRTVVFVYHGSESRPPYINGGYVDFSPAWLAERTRATKENLSRVARYASYVVDNPLACHLHERPICIYEMIGNPVDDSKVQGLELSATRQAEPIRILHAPSAPEIKGTALIRRAVAALRERGHEIDYVELTGVPNRQVMTELSKSDIVVDELFSDMHGAMFSLEACMVGRPAVVGAYGRDLLDRLVLPQYVVPTYLVEAEQIEAAIERLVGDEALRRELGAKAKTFADNYATPRSVAGRFLTLVRGEAPTEWFFAPECATYMCGVGATRETIRGMIAKLIAYGGPEALQLGDKPEVLARFVAFAEGRGN
ncbi:MAG: hypothetical protein ACK4UO_06955 [Pseudolabrys sp.]